MPIEEYVQLVGEKIIDAKYIMSELVDLAWGREIHFGLDLGLGLDLKEEPMEGNDVDDQPTPITSFFKPVSMPNIYQILQCNILKVFNCRCDEHSIFYG